MSSKVYDKAEMSSCPFDKSRSGFVLGEGSGVMVLESEERARKRGAKVLGEIVGYGYTSDGDHLVRPEASGKEQIRAMELACKIAQINLSEINHISTHATSTPAGDEI